MHPPLIQRLIINDQFMVEACCVDSVFVALNASDNVGVVVAHVRVGNVHVMFGFLLGVEVVDANRLVESDHDLLPPVQRHHKNWSV